MAEDKQTTDLAISSGGEQALSTSMSLDDGLQNPDLEEKSTSKLDFAMGDLDLLRQIVLVLSISICVSLIVMLFFWVKEPEMRPLGAF
ncbi:hypothetical protein [Vibrio metschnikovii]